MTHKSKLYAPTRQGARIPMPDRGGRIMPASGAPVDITKHYYARLLADGDIAEVRPQTKPDHSARAKRGTANRK
ncbi:hypothetical protein [Oricola thermophila]|uniref:DUF2635 domain-containing protein n=1 Tax=Oricola thermophila TaxID=2742145 RepID=A0A6N1VHK8_9HYPH|nr:hypothetical protein [Oricola thermophila]QKV20244.1 hypothetical protein HTY61_18195 [Oricola thermophila]